MGREAYLTRLALGRSAYEPPEHGALIVPEPPLQPGNEDISLAAEESTYGAQSYNDRGHPVNPSSRARARRMREAMNEILSVIGIVQRNPSGIAQQRRTESEIWLVFLEENVTGDRIGFVTNLARHIAGWWIQAFTNRLLVFPSETGSSLLGDLKTYRDEMGFANIVFAGLPAFLVTFLMKPELWANQFIFQIDRIAARNVNTKVKQDLFRRARPALLTCLVCFFDVVVLPVRIHSTLQSLGLVPARQLLPSPCSWIPFRGTSIVRFEWDFLPILPFLAYRQFLSSVCLYLYRSCRSVIIEPTHPVGQCHLSGSRGATSFCSITLTELRNIETALTHVFRKVFGFLDWSHEPFVAEQSLNDPRRAGLQRRETWFVNAEDELAATQVDENFRVPTMPGSPRRRSSFAQLAPEEQRPAYEAFEEYFPPIGDEIQGDERNGLQPTSHEGTIRMAPVDPESRAMNLEIDVSESFPDPAASMRAEAREYVSQQDRLRRRLATPADLEWLRQSRHSRRMAITPPSLGPHHLSILSLEPANRLGAVVEACVSGVILMPLRAYVLRMLIKQVFARPEVFGLSRTALPSFASGLSPFRLGKLGAKFALCCAVDLCLELGIWLCEWMVIRYAGTEYFGWGNL